MIQACKCLCVCVCVCVCLCVRRRELQHLSRRKYLDAMCVFLWASMPVLVPFFTFSCAVLLSERSLSAADVITTIALLNMLIFPMNAFPWVVSARSRRFSSNRQRRFSWISCAGERAGGGSGVGLPHRSGAHALGRQHIPRR